MSRFICKNCGGDMVGNGYSTVIRCENVDYEDYCDKEPDSKIIYCNNEDKDSN